MINTRELILGRLRAAAPAPSDSAEIDMRIDQHYAQRRVQSAATDMAEALAEALTRAHATAWCASSEAWPQQVAERLRADGVRKVLLDPNSSEGAALARAMAPEVEAIGYDRPIEEWKSELFHGVDAGFTVARSGIAGAGALVLAPDAGTPRTVSLVPPLHIALVYASTLFPDLHALARAERWADGMPSNLVLVSGPSKTSDIQQTLAYGAHGPSRMWVVIIHDEVKA